MVGSPTILKAESTPFLLLGVEYVKVVLQDGRMIGAILIGETDLEVCNFKKMKDLEP